MLEKMKIYLIEVILKKYGPSFLKGSIAWLFLYFTAHQGFLNSHGITWDGSGHTLDIDFDVLAGNVWTSVLALMAGSGGLMAALTAFQHHTVAAATGAPQSGDKRETPTEPIVGGYRKDDIKTGDQK